MSNAVWLLIGGGLDARALRRHWVSSPGAPVMSVPASARIIDQWLLESAPHRPPSRTQRPGLDVHSPHNVTLLRIFTGESDRCKGQPLGEAIVLRARERHPTGATVVRGPTGFGESSRPRSAKTLRFSMDLPAIIDILDTADRISDHAHCSVLIVKP